MLPVGPAVVPFGYKLYRLGWQLYLFSTGCIGWAVSCASWVWIEVAPNLGQDPVIGSLGVPTVTTQHKGSHLHWTGYDNKLLRTGVGANEGAEGPWAEH